MLVVIHYCLILMSVVTAEKITGIMSIVVYVDDYSKALDFYTNTLGLEKAFDMGSDACFLKIGENVNGIYLEGGHTRVETDRKNIGVSAMLLVESAPALFERLQKVGTPILDNKLHYMGGENYWFCVIDPSGNILEIVSSEH